jgi:trehalose synthase-fused probable maltokinase
MASSRRSSDRPRGPRRGAAATPPAEPAREPTTDALVAAAASALPGELPGRRWFGAKTRAIAGVTALDHAAVPGTPGVLALFRVDFAEGEPATYSVPLLPGAGGAGATDALADGGFALALVEHMRAGTALRGRAGEFRFRATPALAEILPEPPAEASPMSAEQSNTSVVVGGRAFLKLFRRLEPGPNPDLETTDFLTRETSFRAAPRVGGSIEYAPDPPGGGAGRSAEAPGEPANEPTSLAVLQEFVPNQGDLWTAVLARLGEYYATATAGSNGHPPDPAFARALAAADAKEARALGALTGQLHTALASAAPPAPLAPVPIDAAAVGEWEAAMLERIDRVASALSRSLDTLPGDVRDLARRALDAAPRLREQPAALRPLGEEGVARIRVHGDYHLGQVLRTERGLAIVDFEGEPARPVHARRAPDCALRDVAGMLRSFAYAARAAMLQAGDLVVAPGERAGPEATARLEELASAWEDGVRAAFLEGYLAEAGEAPFLPRRREVLDAALRAFELDKVVYEIGYELDHRPAWARIPLEGLARLTAPPPRPAAARPPRREGPFGFVACLELWEFTGARAEDERQLADLIEQAPLDSIYYHTHAFFLRNKFLAGIYPNDFATWVAVHLRDQTLGERLAMVDPGELADLEALRDELSSVIDDHLRSQHGVPRVGAAEPFDFVRSRIVEVPTGVTVRTLEEFRAAVLEVDVSAIYFHLVEARMRLGRGQNDFAAWLEGNLGLERLAARVRAINPYSGSLERARARLIHLCDEALEAGGAGADGGGRR